MKIKIVYFEYLRYKSIQLDEFFQRGGNKLDIKSIENKKKKESSSSSIVSNTSNTYKHSVYLPTTMQSNFTKRAISNCYIQYSTRLSLVYTSKKKQKKLKKKNPKIQAKSISKYFNPQQTKKERNGEV